MIRGNVIRSMDNDRLIEWYNKNCCNGGWCQVEKWSVDKDGIVNVGIASYA